MTHAVFDTNAEEKAALAAGFNQATHNAFLLFNNFSERLGKKPLESEENLKTHTFVDALTDKNARQAQKAADLLEGSFRFIKRLQRRLIAHKYMLERMNQKQNTQSTQSTEKTKPNTQSRASRAQENTLLPEDYKKFVQNALDHLHALRNACTHGYHEIPECDDVMEDLLGQIFDTARRTIKTRFADLTEREMEHLHRKKSAGKNKPVIDNPDFKYHFRCKNDRWSKFGMTLFCSLFLNKRDAMELFGQISGLKNSHSKKDKATKEVFACFHLSGLSQERLNVEVTAQTLALDMINELARCPKNLYDHLTPEVQKEFQISQSQAQDDEEEAGELLMLRHRERFIPLMMRYLDQTGAFPEMRFMLDLGNLHFEGYPKTILDIEQTRRLSQKVFGFARLPDAERIYENKEQPQSWRDLEKDPATVLEQDPQPFIAQTRPHYHELEDNIALKFVGPVQNLYPKIQPDLSKPSKVQGQTRYQTVANPVPHCWLSRHEMLHLGFLHLLRKRHSELNVEQVEHICRAYRSAMRKVYRAIDNGTLTPQKSKDELVRALGQEQYRYKGQQLTPDDLPSTLSDYLLGLPPLRGKKLKPVEKATRTIDRLLEDTQNRIASLERSVQDTGTDRRNKPGSAKQRPIKAGDLADFVARDIVRFMPAQNDDENQGKPTSLVFAQLQATLAYYGRDKERLPAFYKDLGLIGGANPHPFLGEVQNKASQAPGIIGYYKIYLNARKTHLETVKKAIANNPAHIDSHAWLKIKPQPQTPEAIKTYIQGLLKGKKGEDGGKRQAPPALNLPRKLFSPFIEKAMKKLAEKNPNLCSAISASTKPHTKHNTSYLIKLYFQHVVKIQSAQTNQSGPKELEYDSYPSYYDAPRRYAVIDKMHGKREGDNRFKPLLAQPQNTQYAYNTAETRELKYNLCSYLKDKEKEHANKANEAKKKPSSNPEKIYLRPYRAFEGNEKALRESRTQDQVLFLAMQELLDLEQGLDQELKSIALKNITRDTLDRQIDYKLELKNFGKTIKTKIRIAKVGEFRRFLKDRRLPGLFAYLTQPVICRAQLEQELKDYQTNRIKAFKLIHAFENKAYGQTGLASEYADTDVARKYKRGEHQRLLINWFAAQSQLSEDEKKQKIEEMVVLRNAISHNQYPTVKDRFVAKYPAAHAMLEQLKQVPEQQPEKTVANALFELLQTRYAA